MRVPGPAHRLGRQPDLGEASAGSLKKVAVGLLRTAGLATVSPMTEAGGLNEGLVTEVESMLRDRDARGTRPSAELSAIMTLFSDKPPVILRLRHLAEV
jgi:hypothetical protein